MQQFHPGDLRKQLSRQMREVADARRAVNQFPGPCLGQRNKFLHRARRQRGCDHQRHHITGCLRDGRKVAQRIVRQALVHKRIHGDRARYTQQQRVAVGFGLGRQVATDDAVGARAILYDELLAPGFGKALREHARNQVGPGSRGLGNDDAYDSGGVVLTKCIDGLQQYKHRQNIA